MSDTNSTLPAGYLRPTFHNCKESGVTDACPAEASLYGGYFTLGACIFFVVAHSLALIPQLVFGIRARSWSFSSWLAGGILFELLGYAGRIIMSSNPWVYGAFVLQLVMLILGPTLVAASISVTFKHIVLWYGPEHSMFKPWLYPWIFVGTDLFSILIQSVGGIVSARAIGGQVRNQDLLDVGSALLVAGTTFQMANMIVCGGLMVIYIWRRRHGVRNDAEISAGVTPNATSCADSERTIKPSDKKTKTFVRAISVAYVLIIIRCIYRVPEQQMGWGNDLMQNEATFLTLDGAMMLISIWILTIFHPHFYFPFLSNKSEEAPVEKTMESSSDPEGHEMGSVLVT
ncbi:RTA1 like protein-domain-containing protein [Dactylonectria estremocensis]|uniref:RTA1 like protein-domain-containing protein n=1 Tax=Dactylonectria estremocensis TaxID=1079267 RepID=A0A9P9EU91_9HYPO|nr:RTA1 like protein-domain-containing protein [Dactylonectria estremocensis]